MQDEEKYAVEPKVAASGSSDQEVPAYGTSSSSGKGILAKLRGFEDALDRKIGVETHGIERRRPEDRDPAYASWSNQAVMFLMWMSATTNLSCFATGFLGWELGLDMWRSIVIIIFSTFIGAAVTVRFHRYVAALTLQQRLTIKFHRVGAQRWALERVFARFPFLGTPLAGGPPRSSPFSM